jgi:hypothetical protein
MAAYTTVDDPSAHFQIATWTGDGSTSDRNITNDGNSNLSPDLIWGACRSHVQHKHLTDSSRGFSTGNKELISNATNVEGDTSAVNTGGYGWLGPSLTNGFVSNYGSVNNGYWNVNARTYVAWQWKANGGTTSSNSDGQITSTVQANTTAGFSIVTFTADGTTKTVGHGLGVKPNIVFVVCRNVAGGRLFITDIIDGSMDYLSVNATNAKSDISYDAPTSSVFSYNDNNTNTQVAYCFAEKQGYSKFGNYTGTYTTTAANSDYETSSPYDGPFIYTGFKPAWLMIKRTDSANNWCVFDNKRTQIASESVIREGNVLNEYIIWNDTNAHFDYYYTGVDFVSNGFKIRGYDGTINAYGNYLYMAFAENPFVTSTGVPTTAR